MEVNRIARKRSLDRPLLIGATVVGMALCSIGIGRVAASGQWLSFQGLVGSSLGVVALSVVIARLMGRKPPMIADDRAALTVLLGIAALKVAVAALLPLSV